MEEPTSTTDSSGRDDRRDEVVAFIDASRRAQLLGERQEGIAPGTDRALLRRLRNGEIPRDARIDLHGLAAAAARARVHETLARVHGEGSRCVLVIHGRGRHSETEPILKEALLGWLAEPPAGPLVMAFSSALGGDGGVGATYVLLRRER